MDIFGGTLLIFLSTFWILTLIALLTVNAMLIKRKNTQMSEIGAAIKILRSQLSTKQRKVKHVERDQVDYESWRV